MHGNLAPLSLIGSFFTDVRIYAYPNAGVLYDTGFLIGLMGQGMIMAWEISDRWERRKAKKSHTKSEDSEVAGDDC